MAMKKVLVALFAFAALAFAGLGSAQKYGLYSGYPGGIGGMIFFDNLRLSVGLPFWYGFGIEGGVDMMLGQGALSKEQPLSYYYGAGADAAFYAGYLGYSAFGFDVHGLGGIVYKFSDSMGFFGEALLGVGYVGVTGCSGCSGFGPAYGAKVGLYFY